MDQDVSLAKLPWEAALVVAQQRAKGSLEDWGRGLSGGASVLVRAFALNTTDKTYFVTFPYVPLLCANMGTPFLLDWARARYNHLCAHVGMDVCEPIDVPGAMRRMVALVKEVGEVADAIDQAVEDSEFQKKELKKIRAEVADVVSEAFTILEGVEARLDKMEGR